MIKIKLLEGKTKTERNKIIAAGILGVVAILSLYMGFGRSFFGGSSTTARVKVSTTPKPAVVGAVGRPDTLLPTADEQDFVYQTTPIVYTPGNAYAPDAGRNIFAFYEPPPPCKPGECPTPTPKPPPPLPPPTPAPTPPVIIASVNPQSVFAGTPTEFRIEVYGERFTPDAKIYFNQTELATTFVSPSQLSAQVPASRIAREGQAQVIVQTPDGKTYSNQFLFNIQAPPKPVLQYIGMIGRARYNNDTAVFTDQARPTGFTARLNDVVAGRFRLISISREEVVFQDTSLGFKHRLAINTTPSAGGPSLMPSRGGQPDGFMPYNPNAPGIPANVQMRPSRPVPQKQPGNIQEDVDDDGDGR